MGKDSQKILNIRQNNKFSKTIKNEYSDWSQIKGLSIGGVAEIVADPQGIQCAADCLLARFPQAAEWAKTENKNEVAFLKIYPHGISILDYAKGFGHIEIAKV